MKIVLFGRNGQLGSRFEQTLRAMGEVHAYGQNDLDLGNLKRLQEVLRSQKPQLIVNAAAYTAVDQAESQPELAQRINAEAPGVMAESARELNALLVHYSTDYVFDGQANTPYTEDSRTHPMSVYGQSKWAGEEALRASGCHHLIIRTAWLYSLHGKNFLNTMLRLANERDELRVVNDQAGSPTYAREVADTTRDLLPQLFEKQEIRTDRCGTYHMTCSGNTTWFGFTQKIMALTGKSDKPRVIPLSTAEYPTPARRPAYSVLSNGKLARIFAKRLPSWEQSLQTCLTEGGRGQ